MKRVILASASPRRKELLKLMGVSFETMPSAEEEIFNETVPARLVEALALQKAENIAGKVTGDYIVIGADTAVVAKRSIVLGKPVNKEHAFGMIHLLQGDTHEVYTGVALLSAYGELRTSEVFHVRTEVDVFPMTDEEIFRYTERGECLDKAGAYGIQGSFAEFISGIRGDYCNVVGLPVSQLMKRLRPLLSK